MTELVTIREPVKGGHDWSPEDVAELRRMHEEGCGREWMAFQLRRTVAAVNSKLAEFWSAKGSYETRYGPIVPAAKLASEHFGISIHQMRDCRRWHQQTMARQVAMWLAVRAGRGYAHIGRFFNRDHTTVIHAETKIEKLRQANPAMRELTDALLAALRGNEPPPPPAPVRKPKPLPLPKAKKPISGDPDAIEAPFYDRQANNSREFLEKQNQRFVLAMMAAAEERP